MNTYEFGIALAKILYKLKKEIPSMSVDKADGYIAALMEVRFEAAQLLHKQYGNGAWEEFFDVSVNGKGTE